MKNKTKIIGILGGIIIIFFICFFLKYGNREVAIEYSPIDQDYYVKVYQKGYFKNYEYRCVAILYGPNGEISREYFDAMSTDQPIKCHMDYSVIIEWKEEYVSVSVRDPQDGGITRKFYIDGRISLEERHWGNGF
jgi:hypothetical protein